MVLEVCVDNVKSALNAYNGGATRLELCSALNLGGLTPSVGFLKVVKNLVSTRCEIFVMIRPKPGEDYVYNEHELDVMANDITIFKENGADGFVFGCLDISKNIDKVACKKLLQIAKDFPCTFHRAFDIVKNPEESLITLMHLGFSRILTSGQKETSFLGINLIKKLVLIVKESGSKLIIMPGGGINPKNLREILEATGVQEYHASARIRKASTVEQEEIVWITDESVVREMIEIAESLNKT